MTEQRAVAEDIRIPKSWLSTLVIALILSLLVVAYLLGRQSVDQPAAQSTPGVIEEPIVARGPDAPEKVEQSLSARLDRIEDRVDRTSVRLQTTDRRSTSATAGKQAPEVVPRERETVRQAQSAKTAENLDPANSEPVRSDPELQKRKAYFQQVDTILENTASIDDPNQFATKFLQQAMSGDTSGFNSLLATTRQARSSLESVNPPLSCEKHHTMLLSQLSQSTALLTDVNQAIQSNDTAKLSSVAARGQSMQADTERFKQLDNDLRRDL